ncbi:hypothetical protein [Streptococcus oralis]|nr:hypothetical protein [Streptococcus oralis]
MSKNKETLPSLLEENILEERKNVDEDSLFGCIYLIVLLFVLFLIFGTFAGKVNIFDFLELVFQRLRG